MNTHRYDINVFHTCVIYIYIFALSFLSHLWNSIFHKSVVCIYIYTCACTCTYIIYICMYCNKYLCITVWKHVRMYATISVIMTTSLVSIFTLRILNIHHTIRHSHSNTPPEWDRVFNVMIICVTVSSLLVTRVQAKKWLSVILFSDLGLASRG